MEKRRKSGEKMEISMILMFFILLKKISFYSLNECWITCENIQPVILPNDRLCCRLLFGYFCFVLWNSSYLLVGTRGLTEKDGTVEITKDTLHVVLRPENYMPFEKTISLFDEVDPELSTFKYAEYTHLKYWLWITWSIHSCSFYIDSHPPN